MYRENEIEEYLKQSKIPHRFDTPKTTETLMSAGDDKSSSDIQAFDNVERLVPTNGSTHALFREIRCGPSGSESLFSRATEDLLSLLRYTTVIHRAVVERWSRKIRAIDVARSKRGIAILDELLIDYWSVFVAFKPASKLRSKAISNRPDFEIEMGQMKTTFDSLEKILLSMRDQPVESA